METLGFSDAKYTWSDSPLPIPMQPQVTESAPAPQPDPLADWEPQDIAARLAGGNIRWGVVTTLIVLIVGALGLTYWAYQRTTARDDMPIEVSLGDDIDGLLASLGSLETLNDALMAETPGLENIDIGEVDEAARQLFEAGGALPESQTEARYLATGAAGSALDGVRLAGEARSYLLAVAPILDTPVLETDPSVIALDDAVRAFGDWQLWFDEVRTALPDNVLSDATEQLDVLSGDLTSILGDYIDGLREDDQTAAAAAVGELSSRLDDIYAILDDSLERTGDLVGQRIRETREALAQLQGL
jgi:hypothetical protein